MLAPIVVGGAIALSLLASLALALGALAGRGQRGARLAVAVTAGSALAIFGLAALAPPPVVWQTTWIPLFDITFGFLVDGLALLFAVPIVGISFLTLIYSTRYVPHDLEEHGFRRSPAAYYSAMLLFTGAMLGLVFAADLIQLYVFWEITSIASFLLIGYHWHERDAWVGAARSLIVTVGSGLVMLVGLIVLGVSAGTFSLPSLLARAEPLPETLIAPIVVLVLVGAAAKSAQFPLHAWLPGAMAAPTPVSAFLHSAALVAGGVYLLARVHPLFSTALVWEISVAVVGAASIVVGSLGALRQHDLKALLAYSTISQYGYAFLLLGFGSVGGLEAALFFFLGHAVLKSGLFFVVGAISYMTGERSIDRLSGLWRASPALGVIAATLAFGLAGLPPLLSFWTKERALAAALEEPTPTVVLVVMALGAAATFVYAARFWIDVFPGRPQPTESALRRLPGSLLGVVGVMAALSVAFAARPDLLLDRLVEPAVSVPIEPLEVTPGIGLAISVGSVAAGVILVALRRRWIPWLEARSLPSIERWYDWIARVARRAGAGAVAIQSGYLDRYLWLTLAATFGFVAVLAWPTAMPMQPSTAEPSGVPGTQITLIVLLVLTSVGSLLLFLLRRHLHAIFALAGVGYLLAGVFALLLAPDVALVQVHVETLATVFWVAVLVLVPTRVREPLVLPWWRRLRFPAVLVAALSGLFATFLSWRAITHLPERTVATWYIEEGPSVVRPTDLVSAIITDFRALDTLGEIVVFGVAATGVLAVVRLLRSAPG